MDSAPKVGAVVILEVEPRATVKVLEHHEDDRVTFKVLALDTPRLLHRSSDWAPDGTTPPGYTSIPHLALRNEPEAVSESVTTEFAKEGHQRHLARKADKTLAERVQELEKAHSMGADVGHQLAALRRRVEAAERRLGRDAA